MADKESASFVSKITSAIQTTYTIVEKQARTEADIVEIRAEARALRDHYADLDRRVGKMEEQHSTTDAKIQAVKAEMSAELQKAKAELTSEFHKARYETLTELEREFNKRASELYRQAVDLNRSIAAPQNAAIEAPKTGERNKD